MKKKEKSLFIFLLALVCFGYVISAFYTKEEAGRIFIYVSGEEIGSYPLNEDTNITIEGEAGFSNHLVIKGGKAYMESAGCPDQICVQEKAIFKNKETIVCLPNKIVVEAVSEEEKELDGVT
ncbi:NusG domain II-containing protein [bacterium 1XD42-8]|jgi:hypothetical protein|nr:NusG domain II-containing protein [Lachnospiraceae bacterium]RKJ32570.1 NusG domain II-containing protein [bacterium 1XD42-8]